MEVHFVFDGGAIFIPQHSQSKGVARRIGELEPSGASFLRRSEIGGIRNSQVRSLSNSQWMGGVSDEGVRVVMARLKVVKSGLGGRVEGSGISGV
jgi:hypothetical protein